LVLKKPEPIGRRGDRDGVCPSRETGCGGQGPQVYATVCEGEMALIPVIVPAYTTYEDGTDRVFQNVGL